MSESFDKSMIINSFLDEVTAYIPEIEAHLDRLQVAPDDTEAIEEAYRRTHTISGSAAMMDFSGLAHVAQGMETILEAAVEHRTALDAPTVGLLRRTCNRLNRIAGLIRTGGDASAIVAEDEQDHAAYRGPSSFYESPDFSTRASDMSVPTRSEPLSNGAAEQSGIQMPDWLAAFGSASASPAPAGPPTPQFPNSDTLAQSGVDVNTASAPQHEDPWAHSFSNLPTGMTPSVPMQPPFYAPPSPAQVSGPQARPPESFDTMRPTGAPPVEDPFSQSQETSRLPASSEHLQPSTPATPWGWANPEPTPTDAQFNPALPQAMIPADAVSAIDTMRADEESVRRQAGALHDSVEMLREVAQAMENERTQLQSFLDGSQDALERLEEWAGQQMNLDLRHSPEAVRAYLPLSVIWVTTTRLKKLIALLSTAGRNLTMTQEQIDEALSEFRTSLETLARFTGMFASGAPTPDGGYSATVAQITWAPPASASSSGETLSAGQRADIERSVREELRRSLEDDVRQEIAAEIRREEEQRIRQELEVQIRRQMTFSTLGTAAGESSVSVRSGGVEVRPQAARAPRQVQVTSEQSPEALEVFREEAAEHLQTITDGVRQLEVTPGDMERIQIVRRAMHTLKGAAGMMGFVVIQRLAHASEDLLDQLADQGRALSPDELSLMFETAETLDQLVSGSIAGSEQQREAAQTLIDHYRAVTTTAVEDLPPVIREDHINSGEIEMEDVPTRSASNDLSVRIRLSKLDEIVNLFGELLVNRSIFEERVGRLNHLVDESTSAGERLRDVGNQLEKRFDTFMLPSGQGPAPFTMPSGMNGLPTLNTPGALPPAPWGVRGRMPNFPNATGQGAGPASTAGFDALEMDRYDEFHRLSRILTEIVADVTSLSREMSALIREIQVAFAREARLNSEVQDRLLKARLVPLRTLAPRLYRAARNSASREGKEVEFFIEGGDTEVDRKIVEEVEGPLLHLVRNAVNHGIEQPEQRLASGKPRTGKIVVSAGYEGNQVVIEVQDDGLGIDPQRLRETAVTRGWIDAYATLSDREALNLIFQPGVSTAGTVTEESGRGVGLDVVRDAANRLKGSVEVESDLGAGSIFTLKFPISLQITRAVLVKVGAHTYAVPMAVVDHIGRLDYYERVATPTPAVVVRGEHYPLARLSAYVNQPPAPVDERSSLLIINAGRRRVALIVDGIVAQQEIVVKPLGPHLRDVRGVAGATTLGNGQVVVILELLELLASQIRDTVTLPTPTTVRQDTLPSTPIPPAPTVPAPVVNAQRSAPEPAPYGQPAPFSQPAPLGAQPFAPQAPAAPAASQMAPGGQGTAAWGGPPTASTPSIPLPPFLQQGRPAAPSSPLPPFLQQGATVPSMGSAPGRTPPPPSFLTADQRASGTGAGGQSIMGRQAPTSLPQRAPGTGIRDFVVEPDGRRTQTTLTTKPSYVLVVDDSPSVRTVVTGMLKANGWETQTARDGVEALEVIARKRPAAVLLDIEMPRMDGYELMATLRSEAQYQTLPLIALTSRAADKHRLRAMQLGANAYVVKPYDDQGLLNTIAGLVQRAQSGSL